MKKLFYTLMTLLALYVCFYCIRIYKGRADSAFVSRLVDVRQALEEKAGKINSIHDYCKRKMSAINNKETKQSKDSNITSLDDDNKHYSNLNQQAENLLTTLQTKIKEVDNYITKCNTGFISSKLRKETNEYLTKYFDNENSLNSSVSKIDEDFTKIKEAKKAKEEKKKNEQKGNSNKTDMGRNDNQNKKH